MSSHEFLRDTRGTTAIEYALLLFAVLLGGASAMRAVGPKVALDGSLTARILGGEDISVTGAAGSVRGGASDPRVGRSRSGTSSAGSGGAIASNGGGDGSLLSNRMVASAPMTGGGIVLGASGAPPNLGSFSTDAYSGGAGGPASASNGGSSGATPTFAPHFTSALFQNPAYHPASTPSKASTSASSASSTFTPHFTSALFQNSAHRAPGSHASSAPSSSSRASSARSSNGGYAISAKGRAQMQALLDEAQSHAAGERPLGRCYAAVATYIDAVGYGNMGKAPGASLPSVPDDYGTYAHQFADYMNAKGSNGQTNASRLGLQRLPITNPYKAPPGSIVVVRAGTPGTANPVAGDIVVVGKNGTFYNDGNMGYGGSQNFPAGNTYVLGVYAPK